MTPKTPESGINYLSKDKTDKLLREGNITSCQLLHRGSNCTFLLFIEGQLERGVWAVYKPYDGEIPLWDFPETRLYTREYAAYLVSEVLGWPQIPTTTIREGPYGVGSVQVYVEHAYEENYFTLRDAGMHTRELQQICLFDWLTNNADRKGGHCLMGHDGIIWAIDHGLTFNEVPKLRTVIWDFCGVPVPSDILQDVEQLMISLERGDPPSHHLGALLDSAEIESLKKRLYSILKTPIFPYPLRTTRIPWPLI